MNGLLGGNIANVERIEIVTDETTPATYVLETATSCNYNAVVSQGQDVEQRVKNVLMGLLRTDDLVKGYDIELEDQRLHGAILALVDGGTLTGAGDQWTKYQATAIGTEISRKSFTLKLYTSDRDTDGGVVTYHKWTFPDCKGSPVSGGAADGSFTNMKYSIKSRPAKTHIPLTVDAVESLPSVSA